MICRISCSSCKSCNPVYDCSNKNNRRHHCANVHEQIAVPRVKSVAYSFRVTLPYTNIRLKRLSQTVDESIGGYLRRQATVRNTKHRSTVFDRAKDRIREMLSHHGCRPEIPVVRYIDQHVRSIMSEPPRDPRIRRLDADEDTGFAITERHQRVVAARSELTDDSTYQRRSR